MSWNANDLKNTPSAVNLYKTEINRSDAWDRITNMVNLINTTYTQLKSSRDNGELIPGQFYRITDYVTTTTQAETQSAGHVFDVIVRADSVNVLNENAYAIQHEGDTYFNDSNLSAWRLKYTLDNDTTKYAWADDTNGKGVIYEMIDEFNNRCGYDFKNIQMKFYKITATSRTETNYLIGTYCGSRKVGGSTLVPANCTISTTDTEFRYTFDLYLVNGTHQDYSLKTYNNGKRCYNNNISNYFNTTYQYINQYINIISFRNTTYTNFNKDNFFGGDCTNNSLQSSCEYNYFGGNCNSNSIVTCSSNYFGSNCVNNLLMGCANNFLGDYAQSNILNSCAYNSFENYAQSNILPGCAFNSFGSHCRSNIFGTSCNGNSLGNDCANNTFGNSCSHNSLGNSCTNNTLGDGCSSNSLGDSCFVSRWGNTCVGNSLGNNCNLIAFGDGCDNNSFSNTCNENYLGSECKNNHFGNGCSGNVLNNNCNNNSFNNSCTDNNLGDNCSNNDFAINCSSNSFQQNCNGNTFQANSCDNTLGPNCINNNFGNNCFSNWLQEECCFNTLSENCFCNELKNAGCCSNFFWNNCTQYVNIDFSGKTIKLGFKYNNQSYQRYGFIYNGGWDESNGIVYIEGTIYNNFDMNKIVNITIDFNIRNSSTNQDDKYTVKKEFNVPANSNMDFKIEQEYSPDTFSRFSATGTATFAVGNATITANGYYG